MYILYTTYRLLLVQNQIIILHYFDHISIINKKSTNLHYLGIPEFLDSRRWILDAGLYALDPGHYHWLM